MEETTGSNEEVKEFSMEETMEETMESSEEVRSLSPEVLEETEVASDEKTWAMFAHLSILLGAITAGLLGPVAAFVIWLVQKDESDYVAKQALQSLIYQIVAAVLSWVMWIAIGLLIMVGVGCCLAPFGVLLELAVVGYGCYAAYECSLGQEFKYPLIWDMITE